MVIVVILFVAEERALMWNYIREFDGRWERAQKHLMSEHMDSSYEYYRNGIFVPLQMCIQ